MRHAAGAQLLVVLAVSCVSCGAEDSCAAGESEPVRALVLRAKATFDAQFGAGSSSQPGVAVTFAPGRVNLIGEHTDYRQARMHAPPGHNLISSTIF